MEKEAVSLFIEDVLRIELRAAPGSAIVTEFRFDGVSSSALIVIHTDTQTLDSFHLIYMAPNHSISHLKALYTNSNNKSGVTGICLTPETLQPLKNDLLCCVQLWSELATQHTIHISISVIMLDPGQFILPWRKEGSSSFFRIDFFSTTTSIFLKSWFLNKIGASRSWQQQWQNCQPAYDCFASRALCWGEWGCRDGIKANFLRLRSRSRAPKCPVTMSSSEPSCSCYC